LKGASKTPAGGSLKGASRTSSTSGNAGQGSIAEGVTLRGSPMVLLANTPAPTVPKTVGEFKKTAGNAAVPQGRGGKARTWADVAKGARSL